MPALAPPLRFPTFASALTILNPSSSASAATTTYTIVCKYLTGALAATGAYVRLVGLAPLTGNMTLTNTYIGNAATSGNAWDFAATPTRVTWDGGQNSKTVTAGTGTYYSDLIPFVVDDTRSIAIAYDTPIGTFSRYASNLTTDYVSYYKQSVNEASTAAKGSGYTAIGKFSYFLELLQVDS